MSTAASSNSAKSSRDGRTRSRYSVHHPLRSGTPELPSSHWSYGLLVPHDPRAASVVRAALRGILRATRLGCVADTVELLASELVTNAYRHSPSDAYVSVEHTPQTLTVSVWDHGPGTPVRADVQRSDAAESGRGLGIVEMCADEWGVREYPYGKAVWFRVAPKEEA